MSALRHRSALERLPLSSVRMFVVVARLLSISRAAEELNVTPSAVSHQMKVLESYLGATLFRRERNRLSLTAAGQQYMLHCSEGLTLLSRATRAIRAAKGQQILRVGAPASIAALWLVSRLGRFMERHPEISLHLTACANLPALLHASVDVGLLYGHCTLAGWSCEPLGENRLFPVCSPALLKGADAPRTPADLARCVLLDSSDETYYAEPRQPGWHGWLEAAGVPEVNGTKHLAFTPRALMHPAVRAGYGIGLTRTLLAIDALVAREIVLPFGPAPVQPLTYQLACTDQAAKRTDVAAFREWVLEEARGSTKQFESILRRMMRARARATRSRGPGRGGTPGAGDVSRRGAARASTQEMHAEQAHELGLTAGARLGEHAREL